MMPAEQKNQDIETTGLENGSRRELLYKSETTQVFRLLPADGTGRCVIKEPLGKHAAARLAHETKILGRLTEVEGVPRLLAVPHPAGSFALEDDEGVPVLSVFGAEGAIRPELLDFARRLAAIVAAVHRAGVLHLDINPANILLAGPGRGPLLIDFHLAVIVGEEPPDFIGHHDIVGTLPYIAPEQTGRTGRAIDQRADLYALGATFYQLVTGRPPFPGDDPLRLIHDHLVSVPIPPVELNALVPKGLSDIILRLLEKDPDHRYHSAEGLYHDLSRLAEELGRNAEGLFPLGERDFPRHLSPSSLVGREAEIAVLEEAFERALNTPNRVVLITGAAGVGKTSLADELRRIVGARGGWFVSGKFDQYRQDTPTATVQALRALGRLILAEPEAAMNELRERILTAIGANAGLIATQGMPEYLTLLGKHPVPVSIDPVENENRLLATVLEGLRAIASPDRPVVMVLDDLQWAGAISIRFIDRVLNDERMRGLLLAATCREEGMEASHPLFALLPRWQRMEGALKRLTLRNLSKDDLGEFLAEMLRLQPDPAARLSAAVGEVTAGNPYDTIELINTLRYEGALRLRDEGWVWDSAAVRAFIGGGDVVNLISTRLARLPAAGRAVLNILACLGGEPAYDLLRAAADLPAEALGEALAAPIDAGLLLPSQGTDGIVRFSHNRVQQAVYDGLPPDKRNGLHLAVARRLVSFPGYCAVAAAQYLAAADALRATEECLCVIRLFRDVAEQARQGARYETVERFVSAAIALSNRLEGASDGRSPVELEIAHHEALYSLGRLDEADRIYAEIERRCADPMDRVEAACVQVCSLDNRGRPSEAAALGLELLRQLGLDVPPEERLGAAVSERLDDFLRWGGELSLDDDLKRPEITDERALKVATLLTRLMAPSRHHLNPMVMAWLVLEGQRQWLQSGPCAKLVGCLCHAMLVTIATRQEYRIGYNIVRHVLAFARSRDYSSEIGKAVYMYVLSCNHWFEPLENSVTLMREARKRLLEDGDLQYASNSYYSANTAMIDTAPTIEACAEEVQAGLAMALRTGNDHGINLFLAHRQFLRALSGQTREPGSLTDAEYDESARLESLGANPSADATFLLVRTLTAVLFGDMAEAARRYAALAPLRGQLSGFYAAALVHLLAALASAERIKTTAPDEQPALLAELDAGRDWLERRAADAPGNFLHLLHLVNAERAWAAGDHWQAACSFDNALSEVESRQRPWHKAFITERAGLFHLALGMERAGRKLLAEARQAYDTWGAVGKVRQLERTHLFLRAPRTSVAASEPKQSTTMSIDGIDLMAILRVSQALSSETSLSGLKTKVIELLGSLTGATSVRFALWNEKAGDWFLSTTNQEDAAPVSVEEAGARGLFPLTAFRYVERTRETLLLADATRDDRFARDSYIAALQFCSMLFVPILTQGTPRAVLLLENRLGRGAFSADRLDAVMMIAGQLAVSLENALLYEKLEERVRERTSELTEANAALRNEKATQAELIAKLAQAHNQLLQSEKMASVGQLAAGVAHEINNPIGYVFSNFGTLENYLSELFDMLAAYENAESKVSEPEVVASLLKLREKVDLDFLKTDIPELIRESKHGIERVRQIVKDLRDFSRVDSEEKWELANLHQGIDSTLNVAANEIKYKADVIKEYGSIPEIECLPAQVNQVIMNLVINAAQAMGEQRGRITIRTGTEGDQVWLEVSDTGSGIPPEILNRIFEPFFTTKPIGKGTGLGLSISFGIVQKHNGRIDVKSAVGEGTTFRVTLPVRQPKQS